MHINSPNSTDGRVYGGNGWSNTALWFWDGKSLCGNQWRRRSASLFRLLRRQFIPDRTHSVAPCRFDLSNATLGQYSPPPARCGFAHEGFVLARFLGFFPLTRLLFFQFAHAIRGTQSHGSSHSIRAGIQTEKRRNLRAFLLSVGQHVFVAQQQEVRRAVPRGK